MASPANDLRIAATMEDLLKRGACFEPPDNVHPNEDEVTQLLAMPVVLRALIDVLKANPGSLSSLKTVGVGGSVISIPWSKEFLSLIDLESYRIIYGMSECLLASATPDKEKWVTSIGRPMPGVEMKIVDSEGNTLGPHEAGEIAVNAPCNMKGYDKNPKATSEIFIDGWLMTGDCGYMDEEGFFFIKERIKEMIKCMDNQVAPAELEDYLVANHQGVKEVAVIGLPNDEVGEAPTAYVVLNEGVDPSEELRQKLVDMVKEEFATFKQLYGGVFFVTSVPKTDSGKFAKVDLKKQVLAGEYETF
ncbi:luciferin 4-monooxygenase-like [Tropilaelaps mercedesae]|uniref:Luciferin 4-monooxygenase-like n=1 Tax=Tropilaelaps mercedesae TaxID=418985 RepID=A0A1V9WZV2_9ACAR|nr:luciferin 4-monooxygenase-like [Tropilaelaps mercedesae]